MYGDANMAKVMFGIDAIHVPAWMYFQGPGNVLSFVGGSKVPAGTSHPALYGHEYPINFMVGEIIVRPHFAIGTRALMGHGLASLAMHSHDLREMLAEGELIAGSEARMRRVLDEQR
jgi:hypothetical protein